MTNMTRLGMGDTAFSSRPLRIVLAALCWDYGQKQRGLSYEYYNLYLSLKELYDVQFFDFYNRLLEKGKQQMNHELLGLIKRERPDLTIFPLFQEEFIPEVIEALKQFTTTLCYFFDDAWRIEYAKRWAPRFDYFTTASTHCLRRYKEWGYNHAIYSPFGFNHALYRRKELPKQYDVSFVGGFHPYRQWIIKQLQRAGLQVVVWGGGKWGTGKLDQEDMIDVFNQTRVNLNISNSVSWDLRYLCSSIQAIRNSLTSAKTRESLKGRNFELCGCGAFQLTYYVEDLELCYDIGREIVIYSAVEDLIEKIRYYLKYEDEREAIAAAGYRRAIAQHTYAMRFKQIMKHIFGENMGL